MLSKIHRFHGLGSLKFVYRQGKTIRSPNLGLKFAINHRRQTYRAAIVVSRKVNKSAVARNRIRRRIYEVVQKQGVNIKMPYDLVFIAFSDELTKLTPKQLEILIKELLQRANVISSHDIVNTKEA